jgi:hypothetical protein
MPKNDGELGTAALAPALLPYVPSALPDELLQSVVARTATKVGNGAWLPFLRGCGWSYGFALLYAASPRNEVLRRLVEGLGMDFNEALESRTLYPYWTRFTLVEELSLLGQGRMALRIPRFCGACIQEDIDRRHAAYWHRTHQLPNVYGCEKHHTILRDRCDACGRIPSSFAFRSTLPLSPLCACGADLRKQRTALPEASAHWRLVSISCEALLAPKTLLASDYAVRFLRLISQYYGSQRVFSLDAAASLSEPGHSVQVGVPHSGRATSREICAFLALRGLDLRQGLPLLGAEIGKPTSRAEFLLTDRTSLAKYKRSAIQRLSSGRYSNACLLGTTYWVLRIRDPDWLERNFPANRRRPLPSIDADRREIVQALQSGSPYRVAAGSFAAIRARIRDRTWLHQLTRDRADRAKTEKSQALRRARSLAILEAAEALRHSAAGRVTCAMLGQLAGLSIKQVSSELNRDPKLKKVVSKVVDYRHGGGSASTD